MMFFNCMKYFISGNKSPCNYGSLVVAKVAQNMRAPIIDARKCVDNRRRARATPRSSIFRMRSSLCVAASPRLVFPRFASCRTLRRLALPHPASPSSTTKVKAGIGRKRNGERGKARKKEKG